MKEKHKYICEVCNAEFNDYEQAKEHEERCSIRTIPIRAIVLSSDSFTVMNYPNAQYWINSNGKDRINLMPNVSDSCCNFFYQIEHFNFDKVKRKDDSFIIYTTNMSEEYLKECMKKLIDYRIDKLYEEKKSIEDKIKQLEEKKEDFYKSEVSYKENLLVEYMD